METKLTEMLGIEYPILCGGMYGLSDAKLVSSISNAGGLGFIASGHMTDKEMLRNEIRRARTLTDKPFGVNISLLKESKNDLSRDFIDVVIEEKVPIVETAGNDPSELISRLKSGGVKVLHKVVTARHAIRAVEAGADAIILVGYSAGGHPGMEEVCLFVNLPETIASVDVPVIAAGGIATGKGMASAIMMGADGVLMGSAFAVTEESLFHRKIKERIVDSKSTDTAVVFKTIRNAFRCLKNDLTKEILEKERQQATPEELLKYLKGFDAQKSYLDGDVENIFIPIGQVIGLINDIPTCKVLIDRIVSEYNAIVT